MKILATVIDHQVSSWELHWPSKLAFHVHFLVNLHIVRARS